MRMQPGGGGGILGLTYRSQQEQQGKLYSEALTRLNTRLEEMRTQFGEALTTLKGTEGMFQKGGEFVTSQYPLIEQGTRQAVAAGNLASVRSGMSSGTNAVGLLQSALQQEGIAKAGVETQRIGNLANIQTAIAGLYGTQAQIMPQVQEPQYANYYSQGLGPYLSSVVGSESNAFSLLAALRGQQTSKANAQLQS